MKKKKKEPNLFRGFVSIFLVVVIMIFFILVMVMPFINYLKSIDFDFPINFESRQDYIAGICEDSEGRMIEGDCYLGSKCDKFLTIAVCQVRGTVFQISSYHNDTIIDVRHSDRIRKHCSILTKTNEQPNCSRGRE